MPLAIVSCCGFFNSPAHGVQFDKSGNPIAETKEEQKLLDGVNTSAFVALIGNVVSGIGGAVLFHGINEPSVGITILGAATASAGMLATRKNISSCIRSFSKMESTH